MQSFSDLVIPQPPVPSTEMPTVVAKEEVSPVVPDDLPLESAYRWEREKPDAVFMVQPMGGGRVVEYTWRQTMDEARRMASYLRSLELPARSRIGLLSKNCAHFFIMDLAIWMAGHISVAVYPTVGADTLAYVLEHAGVPVLFVGKLDDWASMAPGMPAGVQCITCELSPAPEGARWDAILAGHAPLEGEPTRDGEDTAIILYTSGSTGRPKGVEQSFAAGLAFAKGALQFFDFGADDRVLSYLPLAHVFERSFIQFPVLHCGARVYFAESLETFVDDLKRARPTVFHSVPRLWLKFRDGVEAKIPTAKLRRLLRMPLVGRLVRRKILAGLGLDAVRVAATGSAPIPVEVLQWYHDLGIELLEGYAMSENFACCTCSRPGRGRPGKVGEPMPGVGVRIAADGEVQMIGTGVMKGYYRDPERTRAAFTEDGWLRTGDRGELDEDGLLRLTGRVKELFKTSKGKYVSPAPIENRLNANELVEASCVMGSGKPQPYAVVMLSEQAQRRIEDEAGRGEVLAALGALLREANDALEKHERLRMFLVADTEWRIDNGLLTPTLKIKRAAVEARYTAEGERVYDSGKSVVLAREGAL